MKKWILAAVPCAFAAGLAALGQLTAPAAAADNAPKYTVSIPASVELGETANLTADASQLSEGQSVRVWLTGTGESDNAFRLHSDANELTYAITQDGEEVGIGAAVLTAKSGDAVKSAALAFSLPKERAYPGEYAGTVQFTVSAVDENIRSVAIPGMGYVNATEGEKSLNIGLYNPEGNPCYFRYEIVLKDLDETIYQSEELLAPGQSLDTIELTRALDAGTYQAILKVTPLSLDDKAELNGSEIGFELRVK